MGAIPLKIVIGGGFGVGKTTFVGAVSEIPPLRSEAAMTDEATGIDDGAAVRDKVTTTAAMDFGRRTIDEDLVLYLFGTPGQDRYWFMWDDVTRGAVGAVVLVDTRRLTDAFGPIDFFEDRHVPFVVAVNMFHDSPLHSSALLHEALSLPPDVPLVLCDARDDGSAVDVLVALVEHALSRALASR